MKISASEKINHTLERILILIGFIIAVYFMRELKGILVPLVFAIFLAFLLNPFVSFLTDRKIPGWLIMLIVLIVVSVVLFLLGIIVYAGVSSFVEDFPYYLDKLLEI